MARSARLLIWVAVAACSSRSSDAPKRDEAKAAAKAPAAAVLGVDDRYDAAALGAITFEHSEGTPAARAHFTRGLLALHSFWYDEANREFQAAIDADPTMNMAYWGAAMSRLKVLWGEDDLGVAREVLSRMPDPDRLTPREQAWVMAAVELVRGGDVRSSRRAFAKSLEGLHRQFPDDESATFLAVALLSTTRPEDPDNVIVRRRAAALAIDVYTRNPKHPGAAHYLIHAHDTPELAAEALPYAREYARFAPPAFHARHMPAHIFSRLGMWKEAITSCQAAWDASIASAKRAKLSANHHDFHSLQWIVEMSFELGRHADAKAALDVFAGAVRAGLGRQHRALYATEVASYMMRMGAWSKVDELLAPLDAPVLDEPAPAALTAPKDTRVGAPSHCAPGVAASPLELAERLAVLETRARASAMQKDRDTTKRLLGEIAKLRTELRPFLMATQPEEALERIDAAQARRRQALTAHATGNDRALLDVLLASEQDAESEGAWETGPSGFLVSEQIADTLLRLGRAKEAQAAYARTLATHPRRAHAVLGLARSATRAGAEPVARRHYEQLVELWADADASVDGLAEARAALSATP